MRITSKGQVTIPITIRERLGFLPETEVEFHVDGRAVRIVKTPGHRSRRGARIVASARGSADLGMSTDDILALTRGGGPGER